MITIVDSGGANIASIQFGLERLGVEARLSSQAEMIQKSTHVILPGVGSAEYAMRRLSEKGLVPVLKALTQPVLGICLGMQILFESSEEGGVSCLGLLPGSVKKLSSDAEKLIIPHMGWNQIQVLTNDPLMRQVPNLAYAYFVHSYAAPVGEYTSASAHYGCDFSAAVRYRNFCGTQFHPERSSELGSMILKNFLEL